MSKELIGEICTTFYRYWHNAPGTNTDQGFEDWWKDQDKFKAAIALIESQQAEIKKHQWISVEDRLPNEIIDLVLVTRDTGVKSTLPARYIDGKFKVCSGFDMINQYYENPTHWMPLPELEPEPDKE